MTVSTYTTPNDPVVSIIIVNFNGRDYLSQCLNSLLRQTFRSFEVIVVDNGSTDGSTELIRSEFPEVRVFENNSNLGFAKANNIGFSLARGSLLVTLNNDVEADEDFLKELVSEASEDEKVGMVAARMLNYYDRDRIDSAGLEVDRALIAADRGRGEKNDNRFDQQCEVFGPCAGAALWQRDMIEGVGGFDERYFIYYEDYDLAFRARWAGWKCLYAPKSKVYHMGSATVGKQSPLKFRLLPRNLLWTLFKNAESLRHLVTSLIIMSPFLFLALLYSVIVLRKTTMMRGLVEMMIQLAGILEQRQELSVLRTDSANVLRMIGSEIRNPFYYVRRK